MNHLKNNKKAGFTVSEIAIAVLIVGLLLALTLPVIRGLMEKSDDYAYYMAYRSVEKLGGQIVALGDPEDTLFTNNTTKEIKLTNLLSKDYKFRTATKIKSFFNSVASRFVYTEKYVFKMLFPKSFAANMEHRASWDSDMFEVLKIQAKVCNGEQIKKGTNEAGEPIYITKEDFGNNCDIVQAFVLDSNICASVDPHASEYYNYIASDGSTAKGMCDKIKDLCNSATSKVEYTTNIEEGYTGDDGIWNEEREFGECSLYVETDSGSGSGVESEVVVTTPKVLDICKPEYGYYGMYNAAEAGAVSCECLSNLRPSNNNDRACCPYKAGYKYYAKSNLSTIYNALNDCIECPEEQDFNPQLNRCCPKHSAFNGARCEAVEGYEINDEQTETHRVGCAKGSHYDEDTETCILNAPILRANRLCQLIAKNWNIDESYCTPFSGSPSTYGSVFTAATGDNDRYLSINSKNSSFKDVKPNIVLANGLKLWILGDRAASILGLSYSPAGITSATRNMCKEEMNGIYPIAQKDTCKSRSGAYFCQGEGHCYSLDSDSISKMGDARNCCATADITDLSSFDNYEKDNRTFAISGFTIFVDINGDKGSGTLWEDVFPFFVASNGTVYPGYPLDAPKGRGDDVSNSLYLAGNNAANLSVDVYYYDTTSDNTSRKKVVVYSNVSYARGICFARKVGAYTPYCQNLGLKERGMDSYTEAQLREAIESSSNQCNSHSCLMSVRNKLRFF